MTGHLPLVSLVIPCRNEARFIGDCLVSLLANDYPRNRVEILVVDGMSNDGTRAVVEGVIARDSRVRMLDNVRRVTPSALNLGVSSARGMIVFILGAHSVYPSTYVTRLVDWLERTGADVVGGVCLTEPGADGVVARAIAVALGHPFGVGNSHFRLGIREPRWVDTVPFGGYRRELFARFGLFDEELLRNQDDEFNLRVRRGGAKVLLVPDVASRYQARSSLGRLWRMCYQYGRYKPLVFRKVRSVPTYRQLVPPALVAALAGSTALTLWRSDLWPVPLAVAGVYAAAVVLASLSALGRGRTAAALALPIVFPVMHLAYGCGFGVGLLAALRATPSDGKGSDPPLSR